MASSAMLALTLPLALGLAFVGCGSFGSTDAPQAAEDAGTSSTQTDADVPRVDGGDAAAPTCGGGDPSVVFCEDFDDPSRAKAPFGFADVSQFPTSTVGTITLESIGLGGTQGAVVTVANGTGTRSIWLGRDLGVPTPSALGHYELSYDVDILSASVSYAALGTLAFFGTNYVLYPGAGVFGSGSTMGATPDPNASAPVLDTNVLRRWHHVVVKVDREATVYTTHVTIDGVAVGKPLGPEMAIVDDVRIQVGAFFTGPEPGNIRVVYDNVVVRTSP